ncbi:hypothetical protein, partial [Burkholderia cenocepacia]|uniref:hypothetical protein n=1 Tax=Burkholderia cenocepacia TaxID=95486 RepID=UPI0024B7E465
GHRAGRLRLARTLRAGGAAPCVAAILAAARRHAGRCRVVVEAHRQRIALTMRLDDDAAAPGMSSRGGQDRGNAGRGAARPQRSREPEPAGAMAAAFAKLKR